MAQRKHPSVHLVGSVPLGDEETVFRTVSELVGRYVGRIPDGEIGQRANWVSWQLAVLRSHPHLEAVEPRLRRALLIPGVKPCADIDPAVIHFDRLGYADAARTSWQTFRRLQDEGVIDAHTRFQVCLPTPLAPIVLYVEESHTALENAYETRLLAELDEIVDMVPPERLAIQWDTAVEFGMLEGIFPAWFDDIEEQIAQRLLRIGQRVLAGVPLGYHLCYGDAGHSHFVEPRDMSRLVQVANWLSTGLERSLDWIHLPVPRGRDDDAYFAPLTELERRAETELYLGLVHATDGLDGAARRLAVARRVTDNFGVATECGFGRRQPETIPDLLRLHARVAAEVRNRWP